MRRWMGIIILMALAFVCRAQDDTVGFWQVSYNGMEIRPVMMNSESTYLLDTITDSAKINIFYFTESPCSKCQCKLQVRDANSNELKTIQRKGYGDSSPFPFTGKEIKQMMGGKKIYIYFSGKYDGWMPWIFLGAMKTKASGSQ
ncbi:MAG TPA: hypothetical protein VNZ45_16900 [Bacteroidia bacterium]|jgi:hypothetical protein|nr:hypothetical protein [Bacteroidia bacterium]